MLQTHSPKERQRSLEYSVCPIGIKITDITVMKQT